jgi:hypothetical protein
MHSRSVNAGTAVEFLANERVRYWNCQASSRSQAQAGSLPPFPTTMSSGPALASL